MDTGGLRRGTLNHGRGSRCLFRNLVSLHVTDRILDALSAEGIRPILFKGAAFLHTCYRADPGARPMNDVDLLVDSARIGTARGVLEGMGFVHCGQMSDLYLRDYPVPIYVDLQRDLWHLEPRAMDRFRERAIEVASEGRKYLVPEVTDHLILVVLHAAVHHAALPEAWLLDGAGMLGNYPGEIDWDRFLRRLRWLDAEAPALLYLSALASRYPIAARIPGFVWDCLREHSCNLQTRLYAYLHAREPLIGVGAILPFLFHRRTGSWRQLGSFVFPERRWIRGRYGGLWGYVLRPLQLVFKTLGAAWRLAAQPS